MKGGDKTQNPATVREETRHNIHIPTRKPGDVPWVSPDDLKAPTYFSLFGPQYAKAPTGDIQVQQPICTQEINRFGAIPPWWDDECSINDQIYLRAECSI